MLSLKSLQCLVDHVRPFGGDPQAITILDLEQLGVSLLLLLHFQPLLHSLKSATCLWVNLPWRYDGTEHLKTESNYVACKFQLFGHQGETGLLGRGYFSWQSFKAQKPGKSAKRLPPGQLVPSLQTWPAKSWILRDLLKCSCPGASAQTRNHSQQKWYISNLSTFGWHLGVSFKEPWIIWANRRDSASLASHFPCHRKRPAPQAQKESETAPNTSVPRGSHGLQQHFTRLEKANPTPRCTKHLSGSTCANNTNISKDSKHIKKHHRSPRNEPPGCGSQCLWTLPG